MKKILVLILAIGIIATLCACNNIDSVILSTNSCEIVRDETLTLAYSTVPENVNTDGLVWASADENVATVDANGMITAKSVGQTTITVSNGKKVFATCSVTVLEKPAYDLLNDKEREFVDAFITKIGAFKNPNSVQIMGIQFIPGDDIEDFWTIKVNAQNGFGGTSTSVYFFNKTHGFNEVDSLYFTSSDPEYRLDLVNQAIAEKR